MISSLLTRVTGPQSNVACASGFDWANDASGNSPCLVAAAVVGGCDLGTYNVSVLSNGSHYNSPGEGSGNSIMAVNSCTCSWAAYNLFSACTACQNMDGSILTWTRYSTNCSSFLSTTTYYPSNGTTLDNTSIPFYATTNPSTWQNQIFNVDQAQNISDEGHPDVYGAPLTSSESGTSSHKSNAAAIGGGVAGGVVVLILGAIIAWWIIRKHGPKRRNGKPQDLDSTAYKAQGHARSFSDLPSTVDVGNTSFGSGSGNVGTINMQQFHVPGFMPSPFGSSSNMGSVSSMGAFTTPPHQVIQGVGGPQSTYGNSTVPSRYGSPSPSTSASVQFMNRSYSPDSNGHSFVGGGEMLAQPFALPPSSTSPPPLPPPTMKPRTSDYENAILARSSQDSIIENTHTTPQRRMNPPRYEDISNSQDVAAQRREEHGTAHVGAPPVRPRMDEKRRPSQVSETSLGSQDSSVWTTSVGNGNLSYVTSNTNAPTADLAAIDAFVNQMTSTRPGGESGDTVPMLHTTALAPGQSRPGLATRRYTVNTTEDDGNESVLQHAEGEGDREIA